MKHGLKVDEQGLLLCHVYFFIFFGGKDMVER